MKKLWIALGMVSAAALAAGCSLETAVDEKAAEPVVGTHTVTFKAAVTKTYIVEGESSAVPYWSDDDADRMFIYENDVLASNIEVSYEDEDGLHRYATITAEFDNTTASSYVYKATVAKEVSGSKNPKIQSEQAPAASSYDPDADILVADSITVNTPPAELLFNFERKVAVTRITFKGLAEGETVSKVSLTNDVSLSDGYYVIKTKNYTPTKKEVVLNYTEDNTVGSDGQFPVYLATAPVDLTSFTLVVTTDQHVYTKTIDRSASPIALSVEKMTRFNVNMEGCGEEITEGVVYTLVTDTDDLFSGATYIIAASTQDLAMGDWAGGNNHPAKEAVKDDENHTITIDNTSAVMPVVLTKTSGGWTIRNAAGGTYDGYYLYTASTSANRLQETASLTDYCYWTIAVAEGVASINNVMNTTRGVMCLNGTLFNCYPALNTSYVPLALYVDETTKVVTPKIVLTASSAEYEAEDADEFELAYTLENVDDATAVVTAVSSDESWLAVNSVTSETVFYEILSANDSEEDRTATITLSYDGAEDVVFTVTQKGAAVEETYTVTEAIALDDATEVSIEESQVVALTTKGFVISDGTNAVYVYQNATPEVTIGDNVTVSGKKTTYNGVPEITGPTVGTSSGNTDVTYPTVTDITSAFDSYSASVAEYISFTGTLTVSGSTYSIAVDDATKVGRVTLPIIDLSLSSLSGHIITITGYYNGSYTSTSAAYNYIIATSVTDKGLPASETATVAEVLEAGAGTYTMENLTVYAVNGSNVIFGDETGKMLLFKSGHGFSVGDVFSVESATVTVYNSVLEMTAGTFTTVSTGGAVNHGTAVDLSDETAAASLLSTFQACTYPSATYVMISGAQSGRYITGDYAKMYLNVANTTYDGKNVIAYGYAYAYSSSYSFQLVSIEEDTESPAVYVSSNTLSWDATETDEKTVTVTLNESASGYTVSYTDEDEAWTVSDDGAGTITVSPNAANSSSQAKSLTITVIHSDDETVIEEIVCTQMASGGVSETITMSEQGFSNAAEVTKVSGTVVTITFDKGTNSNASKYYTSGTAVRAYGGNTFTVTASDNTITAIEITFGSSDGSNEITADTGTYTSGSWTGSATSVTFTVGGSSGNRRISAIKVTYTE